MAIDRKWDETAAGRGGLSKGFLIHILRMSNNLLISVLSMVKIPTVSTNPGRLESLSPRTP